MTTPSPKYTSKCELLFSDFLPQDQKGSVTSLLLESYRSLLSHPLPVALSVRVMRTGRELERLWELYIEARNKIVESEILRDEAGEPVKGATPNSVQLKDPARFGNLLLELSAQPAGSVRQLDTEELAASGISLQPAILFALEPLLTAEAPEVTPDENN